MTWSRLYWKLPTCRRDHRLDPWDGRFKRSGRWTESCHRRFCFSCCWWPLPAEYIDYCEAQFSLKLQMVTSPQTCTSLFGTAWPSPNEVNFGLLRLQLIWVNVIVGTKEFVKLLRKVLRCIAHIYLHLILITMLHSKSKDKTNLLLWSKLLDRLLDQVLRLWCWTTSFLFLNSNHSRFNI